jgi:hypothetical protein
MNLSDQLSKTFTNKLADGFQLQDILDTLEAAAKLAVRAAFEQLPGSTGDERMRYALDQIKGAWHGLVDAAKKLLVSVLGLWAGFAYELVQEKIGDWGDAQIDFIFGKWGRALLEWAYSVEVTSPSLAW